MKADTLLQVHHAFVYAAYTKKKLDGIELHLIPPGLLAEAFHGFTEQAPAPVLKCNGAGSLQVRPSPVQKNRASGMYRLPWCGGDEEDRTLDLIPVPPAHSGSFYIKYTRRNAMDLALLGVSAYVELEGDVMKTVRIALTTAAPTPIRAEKTEALLTGKTAAPELLAEAGKTVLQESHPRSSWRSSAEFRLALLEELTVQALEQAIALAKEG